MDDKTTQFDKRLSEYRDRLLQRNKEMTTDDDDRIDAIINEYEDSEPVDAPEKTDKEQKQTEMPKPEQTEKTPEPVSESYKEYADKLESVLQEVGMSKKPEKKAERSDKAEKPDKTEEKAKKAEKKTEKKEDVSAAADRERKRLARKNAGLDKEDELEDMELTDKTETVKSDKDDLGSVEDFLDDFMEEDDGHTSAVKENFQNMLSDAGQVFRKLKKNRSEDEEGRSKTGFIPVVNRWMIAGCVLLVIFIILTVCYIAANKSYKYNQMDIRPIAESDLSVNDGVEESTKGYTTIALYGVDSRDSNLNTGTNSDTIILVSINNDTKEVKLVSVYRDTLVEIESDSPVTQKVNYAYQLGGALMSINTLNTNLDLKITDYVTVDFDAMASIINALGGVEVTIAEEEINSLNKNLAEQISISGQYSNGVHSAGKQLLNGQQAVAYTRIRSNAKGDITRTERQRTVLLGLIDKLGNAGTDTIRNLLDVSFSCISTSLTKTEAEEFVKDITSYQITGNTGFPFAYSFASLDGKGNVIVPADMEANVTALHSWLYGDAGYSVSKDAAAISKTIADETGIASIGSIDIEKAVSEVSPESTEKDSSGDGTEEGDTSDVKTITTPPEGMIENE